MGELVASITGAPVVDLIIQTAAIVAALAVIFRPVRVAAAFILRVRDQIDDALERLNALEELQENHGSSVKDRVSKLREKQDRIITQQKELVRAVTQICQWLDANVQPPAPMWRNHPDEDAHP